MAHEERSIHEVMKDVAADLSQDDFHYVIEDSPFETVIGDKMACGVTLIYGGREFNLYLQVKEG
jgi:septum formation inhibitor-activating ATPase MinD